MPLAQDLMGVGMTAEEALREGDVGPQFLSSVTSSFTGGAASTASTIGGPNGATILELQGSSGAALVFLNTTEKDRWYTLYNTGSNAISIFCPIGSSFQTATGSVNTVTVGGVNYIFRLGPVPNPTGSVTADRWIFK